MVRFNISNDLQAAFGSYKVKMTYEAEFIEGTSVKTLWVELMLSKKLREPTRVIKVTPLGEDAVGYMSVMRRLHLHTGKNGPETVVLKTPSSAGGMAAVEAAGGTNDAMRSNQLQETFHATECNFYELLSRGGHNIKIPKIYHAGKNEEEANCIIMEDVVDSKVVDVIPGFDEAQLYTVIDQIVEVQHWGLHNKEWKFPITEEQIELAKSCDPMLRGLMNAFFTKHKDYFGDLGEKLMNHTINTNENFTFDYSMLFRDEKKNSVLVHGDMWTANFLWRGGEIAAIVDWQLAHPGNPVEDLLRVLSTCTAAEIRRKLTKSLINHYYNLLLSKNEGKLPFSRDQLAEEVKFYLPYGCVWTTFAVAFWENSILNTEAKLQEALHRLKTYIEDTAEEYGW